MLTTDDRPISTAEKESKIERETEIEKVDEERWRDEEIKIDRDRERYIVAQIELWSKGGERQINLGGRQKGK